MTGIGFDARRHRTTTAPEGRSPAGALTGEIRGGLRYPLGTPPTATGNVRRSLVAETPTKTKAGEGSYWDRRTASCPQRHVHLEPARAGIRSGKHRCGPVTLITLPSPERRTESVPLLRGLRALDVPDSHDHSASSCDGVRRTVVPIRPGVPDSPAQCHCSQEPRDRI